MNSFGERLKFWRERQGLTQEQLAERCKSSEQVIRSYEKNRNKPGYEMIIRLCDALLPCKVQKCIKKYIIQK